jgi:hypothetical protein
VIASLAGCAHNPPVVPPAREVVTKVQVERVEVPVRMACINAADVPAKPQPTRVDISKADTRQLAAAIAADLLAADAYMARMDIVIAQCVQPLQK